MRWSGWCVLSAIIFILLGPFSGHTQAPGEREIGLEATGEQETPLQLLGLPKPEIAGIRLAAFLVGSFSYNSHLQMVPEFAGGASALADPGATNFRFDKFGLSVARTFAPWLSASATVEVEQHRARHLLDCSGTSLCVERFGHAEAEIETNLERFNITAIVPLGNGLALSIGRFDVPFGIERHAAPLLLTATQSEVFHFGRPEGMTGVQVSYAFAPWIDVSAWVVNRWEHAMTGEEDCNDNNRAKSFGGRLGFTPAAGPGLLNFGIGGFYGPEQDDVSSHTRWVIDVDITWTPLPHFLVAGEVVYGREGNRVVRKRGVPIAMPEEVKDVTWWGFYILLHYDVYDWLGLSWRYGYFDDMDGGRTGVPQVLQSWTFVPIVHLSRVIPDLRPTGTSYPRTRHPIDWVDLKIEYRLNRSNRQVFSNARPDEEIHEADRISHQLQLQLVVNF